MAALAGVIIPAEDGSSRLSETNNKDVDAAEPFCYNHTSLQNGTLLRKKERLPRQKKD
jgi:hypothetical protein